jgi:hypothetical protein
LVGGGRKTGIRFLRRARLAGEKQRHQSDDAPENGVPGEPSRPDRENQTHGVLYVARLGDFTNGGVNPTGTGVVTGTITVLAEFVPSATGLKNSVSICGETTSISLAGVLGAGLAEDSGLTAED